MQLRLILPHRNNSSRAASTPARLAYNHYQNTRGCCCLTEYMYTGQSVQLWQQGSLRTVGMVDQQKTIQHLIGCSILGAASLVLSKLMRRLWWSWQAMHVLLVAGEREAAPVAGIQYSDKLHYMAARRPLLHYCCSPSDESSHKYSSSAPTLNKHKLEQFIN